MATITIIILLQDEFLLGFKVHEVHKVVHCRADVLWLHHQDISCTVASEGGGREGEGREREKEREREH